MSLLYAPNYLSIYMQVLEYMFSVVIQLMAFESQDHSQTMGSLLLMILTMIIVFASFAALTQ